LKGLNDYLQHKKGQFSEKEIKAFVYQQKEVPVKKLEDLKHIKVQPNIGVQRVGYTMSGVLKQMAGLAKSQNYMLEERYKKKHKRKHKDKDQEQQQGYNY